MIVNHHHTKRARGAVSGWFFSFSKWTLRKGQKRWDEMRWGDASLQMMMMTWSKIVPPTQSNSSQTIIIIILSSSSPDESHPSVCFPPVHSKFRAQTRIAFNNNIKKTHQRTFNKKGFVTWLFHFLYTVRYGTVRQLWNGRREWDGVCVCGGGKREWSNNAPNRVVSGVIRIRQGIVTRN